MNQAMKSPSRKYRSRRRRRGFMPLLLLVLAVGCVWLLARQSSGDADIGFLPNAASPKDRNPPQITGIQDLTIYQGDTISYLKGVAAVDTDDPAPKIKVDSSQVDLTKPGIYSIIYTATDAAGNHASLTATVTVLKKEAGFVDLETIYTAVEKKLEAILPADGSAEAQVRAIYNWARSSLSYGGHSDRTDWRQTAYTMLTEGRGDCFGYYAVTKLMFEQLGIPNIDVCKVRNFPEDSDHFWSLVSVDGGENYYHFDATPRVGDGDDFCLVTDAFLDAYSVNHSNCHNRDQSLYPATPDTGL